MPNITPVLGLKLCTSLALQQREWKDILEVKHQRAISHMCAQIYKSLQQHTEAGTWSSALPGGERAGEDPKHGFERSKQTQATRHFLKTLHLLTKVPPLARGTSNYQVWHTWIFRKASYTQTPQMWGKVLKRQASQISLIINYSIICINIP